MCYVVDDARLILPPFLPLQLTVRDRDLPIPSKEVGQTKEYSSSSDSTRMGFELV